jgi:anti-sigma factor RsiW
MHPTEATWRALLDGETEALLVTELEDHLDGCEICQETIDALGRDRTTARMLLCVLDETAAPPSIDRILRRTRRRSPRHWGLVAAMILLGLVTVAGATMGAGIFQPVIEMIRRSHSSTDPKEKRVAQVEGSASNGIALESSEDADVVFLTAQGSGTLTILQSGRSNVEITATAPVPYTVRTGRVTVGNGGGKASYQVTLPRGILRADVWVAGKVVFSKRGALIRTAVKPDSTGKYVLPFP